MVNDGFEPMNASRRGWGTRSPTKTMQSSPDLGSSAQRQRQALSSLIDGDLPAGEVAGIVAGFREDDQLRADWHAYHLIGDVLRSEDLAAAPARDAGFLQALRKRLDQEPSRQDTPPLMAPASVPQATPADRRRWGGWLMAPAAVAAGFVVVAGVLVVNKSLDSPPSAGSVIAQQAPASGVLVRDVRLDRYLAAHRNLGTGLAGSGAGGAERTVQIVYEPR